MTRKSELVSAFALAAALIVGGAAGYVAGHRSPGIGSTMKDLTVYAGPSPTTGKSLYTTRSDPTINLMDAASWDGARDYCSELDLHGHADWRLPDKAELNVLFQNRARIRGFTKPSPYWSSSRDKGKAWAQDFSTGMGFEAPTGWLTDQQRMTIPFGTHLGWENVPHRGERPLLAVRCIRP